MKKCYFGLLLLFALSSYSQNNDSALGTSAAKKSTFELYPNPVVNDIVTIKTAYFGKKDIVIYDVFGEVVLTERISSKTLNVSRLIAGVYVLQVAEKGQTMTRKLVVK